MKNLLARGFMDFYISKKQYESFKTEKGKKNYVYTKAKQYLESLKGKVVNGIEIRDSSITPNNFLGQDFNVMPDIPSDSDKLLARIFHIDLAGVIQKEYESTSKLFFEVQGKNFHLTICKTKVV